jgi:hypothetical protein
MSVAAVPTDSAHFSVQIVFEQNRRYATDITGVT